MRQRPLLCPLVHRLALPCVSHLLLSRLYRKSMRSAVHPSSPDQTASRDWAKPAPTKRLAKRAASRHVKGHLSQRKSSVVRLKQPLPSVLRLSQPSLPSAVGRQRSRPLSLQRRVLHLQLGVRLLSSSEMLSPMTSTGLSPTTCPIAMIPCRLIFPLSAR